MTPELFSWAISIRHSEVSPVRRPVFAGCLVESGTYHKHACASMWTDLGQAMVLNNSISQGKIAERRLGLRIVNSERSKRTDSGAICYETYTHTYEAYGGMLKQGTAI